MLKLLELGSEIKSSIGCRGTVQEIEDSDYSTPHVRQYIPAIFFCKYSSADKFTTGNKCEWLEEPIKPLQYWPWVPAAAVT